MKIELKHLAPYLPYGLKILNGWGDKKTLNYTHLDDEGNGFIKHVKPIIRPLSDFVTHDVFKTISSSYETIKVRKSGVVSFYIDGCFEHHVNYYPYEVVEKLFEHHFDVFGLIPAGLAIDINTINK